MAEWYAAYYEYHVLKIKYQVVAFKDWHHSLVGSNSAVCVN